MRNDPHNVLFVSHVPRRDVSHCLSSSRVEFDSERPMCPRHLYYQTNRDKVSGWSCGI